MSQQDAQDAAARSRIVTHMNKDHHDSIVRYLEHYSKISPWTALSSTMCDVDLNGMTFQAGGKTHHIAFEPPLKSYRDARERVVEMDKQCVESLGRSDITIRSFVPPTGFYLIEFLVIGTTFLAYSQRWWFGENQLVQSILGPGFANFSYAIQPYVFWGMVLIHGTELAIFIPQYLQKHSVSPRSTVFWLWAATVFVEGQFAFMRFKSLVAKKREERLKQKH